MSWADLLASLKQAKTVRELLTEEVEAAYRAETNEMERELIYSDLRDIAKTNRFTKAFEVAFKSFKRSVETEEKELLAQERERRRSTYAETNKINLSAVKNPYPHLQSITYSVEDDGVFLNGTQICTQPVLIFGRLKNAETGEESFSIAYYDGYAWLKRTVKREILFNASKILQLSAFGLAVHSVNARDFVKFLDVFVQENHLALEPKISVSRLGWFPEERFSPYDASFAFDGEGETKDLRDAVKCSGDLSAWVEYMRELRGNRYLRLMMAASFASPLIGLVHALPFVFHLWGGTGTGKTVALMVGMSVWGDPTVGKLVRTMNATRNYMMSTAAFFYSLPVAYDELQIMKLEFSSVEALVMFLTEGVDRGRMKYDEAQRARTWQCCFLFTGEEPITNTSAGGGVYNRVVEVECCVPVIQDGNRTSNFVRSHHGHAGKVFVEHIKKRNVIAMFQEKKAEILNQVNTTGKQCDAAALMLAADQLSVECLFLGEEPLGVADILPYLKTITDVDISERAYEFVCGVISTNVPKFHQDNAVQAGSEIWGRISDGVCLIDKVKLEEILRSGGFSFSVCRKPWAEKGYLRRNAQGRYATHTSINGVKTWFSEIVIDEEELRRTNSQDEIPL